MNSFNLWLESSDPYNSLFSTNTNNSYGHNAWGMIGYALAELMDAVETAHDQETADSVVNDLHACIQPIRVCTVMPCALLVTPLATNSKLPDD